MAIDWPGGEFFCDDLDPIGIARLRARHQRANHTKMGHDDQMLSRAMIREVAHERMRALADLDSRFAATRPNHRFATIECAQGLGIPSFDLAALETRPGTDIEFPQSQIDLDRKSESIRHRDRGLTGPREITGDHLRPRLLRLFAKRSRQPIGLSLTFDRQARTRVSLPQSLGIPRRLAVANQQQTGLRLRHRDNAR